MIAGYRDTKNAGANAPAPLVQVKQYFNEVPQKDYGRENDRQKTADNAALEKVIQYSYHPKQPR